MSSVLVDGTTGPFLTSGARPGLQNPFPDGFADAEEDLIHIVRFQIQQVRNIVPGQFVAIIEAEDEPIPTGEDLQDLANHVHLLAVEDGIAHIAGLLWLMALEGLVEVAFLQVLQRNVPFLRPNEIIDEVGRDRAQPGGQAVTAAPLIGTKGAAVFFQQALEDPLDNVVDAVLRHPEGAPPQRMVDGRINQVPVEIEKLRPRGGLPLDQSLDEGGVVSHGASSPIARKRLLRHLRFHKSKTQEGLSPVKVRNPNRRLQSHVIDGPALFPANGNRKRRPGTRKPIDHRLLLSCQIMANDRPKGAVKPAHV